MTTTIRVMIADDHPLIRSAMRLVLAKTSDIEVVADACNGQAVMIEVARTPADVLLLDVSMSQTEILEVVETLQQLAPTLKIVMVSAYADATLVQTLVNRGVAGYLLKQETEASLVEMIRTVYQGATWFSAEIRETLLGSVPTPANPPSTLTKRKVDILELVATGAGNLEIAHRFGLVPQTVRNYTSQIYEKLEIASRAEAVVWVLEHGLPHKPAAPVLLPHQAGIHGNLRESGVSH
jgi:DNA-binding NarL/FixJ family response regulator